MVVKTYCWVHGRLHLRGAGYLIRLCLPWVRSLRNFPYEVPGLGGIRLDFRDLGAFGILNVSLRDYGHEGHMFRCLDHFLEPNQVLWDVGANVGFFSLYFLQVPHQLRAVHAFEPNPHPRRMLEALFKDQPVVKIHPIGLGKADQTLEMSVWPGLTACGSLVRQLSNSEKINVQIRNGDRYRQTAGVDLPDIIKIDVESYEAEVFQGLVETIALKRPVILFEHVHLQDDQIRQIQALVPADYRLVFLSPSGAITTSISRRRIGTDALLVPSEKEGLIARLGRLE